MDYTLHFSEVLPYLPILATGVMLSLALTAGSTIAGTVLGLFIALARLSGKKYVRRSADVYVEVFRNTPLLIQMYLVYFGLGQFNIQIPPIPAALIAMTLNTAAYTSVILQAGIQAVDLGQKEAAFSLGMRFSQAFRSVILPSAIRKVFPALVNQAVSLFLFSSVASTISAPELTYQAMLVDSLTWRSVEVFVVATALYFACTLLASVIANYYERTRLIH